MIELGLQRITRLLSNTPFPWRAVHVAGTNGKGSICAYVSSMLNVYNQSGYRIKHGQPKISHGRFTSPHIIDRWDGIQIHQQPIPRADFEQIEDAVLARNRDEAIGASEFEIMTATAFEAFTRFGLDVGVVEVGMGGRLDATNIIGQASDANQAPDFRPQPLVTAISSIGLDHQAFLGDTLEAIAAQKSGIIKPGAPVVYDGGNPPEVCKVIEAAAHRAGSPVVYMDSLRSSGLRPSFETLPRHEVHDSDFPKWLSASFPAQFRASEDHAHERANGSVAFRSAWSALQGLGRIPPAAEKITEELQELASSMMQQWMSPALPGRLETVNIRGLTGTDRSILLDGAHNAQSAEVLGHRVGSQHVNPITWVLAASDTKDVKEILRPLIQPKDQVFAVEFGPVDGMPWVKPMKASAILGAVQELVPSIEESRCYNFGGDVLGAIRAASQKSYHIPGRRMVVAGSLYLVSDVHRLLRDAASRNP